MFNKFPFFNNPEDSNEEPFNIPGLFIMGSGNFPNIPNKLPSTLCTILNGEYRIYLNGEINDGDTSKFLFECSKVSKPYIEIKNTIFDAYDFLTKTHFVNFLISMLYKKNIWAYEAIDANIQIIDNDNEKTSKIIMLVETSNVPDYITEDILIDTYKEKTMTVDSDICPSQISISEVKSKSYYRPILTYDISFGFNKNSQITFNTINLNTFYHNFLSKYIMDAIFTFYGSFVTEEIIRKYGEKLLRVQYIVESSDRLMSVRIICTPSMCFSDTSELCSKYSFVDDNLHLIGCERFNGDNNSFCGVSYINRILSSDVSQVIALSIIENGIVNEFCDEYTINYNNFALFTINRAVLRKEKLKNIKFPPKMFLDLLEFESDSEYIYSYWKPQSNIVISTSVNSDNEKPSEMQIYGFVNINILSESISLNDIYSKISGEIFDKFGLSIKDYNNNDFSIIPCYENLNCIRLMIYRIIKDRVNKTKDTKKKHKMWRNKN